MLSQALSFSQVQLAATQKVPSGVPQPRFPIRLALSPVNPLDGQVRSFCPFAFAFCLLACLLACLEFVGRAPILVVGAAIVCAECVH